MNNLLSAYFQRLIKSKLYWCLLGLMILSGIIIPILAHREMIAYGTDYTLESRLVWHFLIIGFIVAIFCSWFLGTDYSDGTIRNKIIAGNSRLKIYISALLICVIASVILVVAHQITIIGLGTWLIAPFKTDIHTISLIMGISILATITFAGINTMIVMINQNKASSSIICLVVINNVLEDCISSYYAIFKEKGITPNINLCEQKIVRSVDKTALLRIFNNVIDNAIKYSEGDLTISLFENGKIVFSNHTSDLNEIQIGKLFDRFYTVNTARKSTGLGLSIAKALIEKMDGNISADYSNNVLSIIIKLNEV